MQYMPRGRTIYMQHISHVNGLMYLLGYLLGQFSHTSSIQVTVPSWLPDLTWVYANRKEVVTLVHFLNTNNSCVHTHLCTQKDIHTLNNHAPHAYIHPAKRKWCFLIWSNTRNLSLSYSPSNHSSVIHTHTQPQIYTFSHANLSFFSLTPTSTIFFFHACMHKCAHTQINTQTLIATVIPAHGTDTQFVWSLVLVEKKQDGLGQAWLKIYHMQLQPHSYKSQSWCFMSRQFNFWLPQYYDKASLTAVIVTVGQSCA